MSHQTSWWPFSFLLRPFHRPGVYVPQPTAVLLIHGRITPSSWIIRALMPSHAERKSACVSSTDHGHLAQYGCDGTHKEAGRGSQLVEPWHRVGRGTGSAGSGTVTRSWGLSGC